MIAQFCKIEKKYVSIHTFQFPFEMNTMGNKNTLDSAPFHTNYGYDIDTGVKRAQNLV